MNTVTAPGVPVADGLEWIHRRGLWVTLSDDGERVALLGPKRARNDKIRAFLIEHRAQLLALLRSVNGDFHALRAEVLYRDALAKAAEFDASGEPVPYPRPPSDRTLTYEEWITQYLPWVLHNIKPEQRPR
jgi:hypothetical protein